MKDFIAMGGYAIYVWPAYFVTIIILAGNVWFAARIHERRLAEARRYGLRRRKSEASK